MRAQTCAGWQSALSSVRPPTASGTQLGQLKLMFGPHVPTGADGLGTRGMGAHHPGESTRASDAAASSLLAGQLLGRARTSEELELGACSLELEQSSEI